MHRGLAFITACCISGTLNAQLIINGGTLNMGSNAAVSLSGNLSSSGNITGAGKLVMNGAYQQLNMTGHTISNLEVNSTGKIELMGNARISSALSFVNGKIDVGLYKLVLEQAALVTGAGPGKFIETSGGELAREVNANGNYILPVGTGSVYMPLEFALAGSSFTPGAYVSAQLFRGIHFSKPIKVTDYLIGFWKPIYQGITSGTVGVTASYTSAAGVHGNETKINSFLYNGTNWIPSGIPVNTVNRSITFTNISSGDELYAMNKFILADAKVFLQGAYNTNTGKMDDALRKPTNLIPLKDPYSSLPYSQSFVHVSNPVTDSAFQFVFADQAVSDNNIVDWLFLELRNASNVLVQTRSVLLQKDGDVVDVDGKSPVAFLDQDPGNYTLTVRHRNHLGISADASTYAKSLSLAAPQASAKFNFSTASDAEIHGTSLAFKTINGVNVLWAGNGNADKAVRYSGPGNDHFYMVHDILNGNIQSVLNDVYSPADINMDRKVAYSGSGNDNLFLLSTILGGSAIRIINQQINQ